MRFCTTSRNGRRGGGKGKPPRAMACQCHRSIPTTPRNNNNEAVVGSPGLFAATAAAAAVTTKERTLRSTRVVQRTLEQKSRTLGDDAEMRGGYLLLRSAGQQSSWGVAVGADRVVVRPTRESIESNGAVHGWFDLLIAFWIDRESIRAASSGSDPTLKKKRRFASANHHAIMLCAFTLTLHLTLPHHPT